MNIRWQNKTRLMYWILTIIVVNVKGNADLGRNFSNAHEKLVCWKEQIQKNQEEEEIAILVYWIDNLKRIAHLGLYSCYLRGEDEIIEVAIGLRSCLDLQDKQMIPKMQWLQRQNQY